MKTVVLCSLLVSVSAFAVPNLFGKKQAAAVKGRLMCNGEPAENIKVKLYDVDRMEIDDLMDEGFSNERGEFQLAGTETELTTIDPKLNIYHKCGHTGLCFKKVSIVIPDSFVVEGEKEGALEKVFDIGELNLAGKFSGESTDCIN